MSITKKGLSLPKKKDEMRPIQNDMWHLKKGQLSKVFEGMGLFFIGVKREWHGVQKI